MLNRWKRLLALLASVAVLFSLCTAASAAPGGQAEPRELTAADYAAADAIFASLPSADGTNGGTAGAADTGALCRLAGDSRRRPAGHGLCERQLRDLADGCGHHLLV